MTQRQNRDLECWVGDSIVLAMGLFSDLDLSDANGSFAEAEKAAHLVSIDADDSFSVIVSQTQSQAAQSQQKPSEETTLAAAAVLRLANKKKAR